MIVHAERTVTVPDRSLSPNAREHWARRHRSRRKAKDDAIAEFSGVSVPACGEIIMHVRWFGRTKQILTMDDDNGWAMLKPTRDGIAHALDINDHRIKQGTMKFAHDAANPRLEITLTTEGS